MISQPGHWGTPEQRLPPRSSALAGSGCEGHGLCSETGVHLRASLSGGCQLTALLAVEWQVVSEGSSCSQPRGCRGKKGRPPFCRAHTKSGSFSIRRLQVPADLGKSAISTPAADGDVAKGELIPGPEVELLSHAQKRIIQGDTRDDKGRETFWEGTLGGCGRRAAGEGKPRRTALSRGS